MSLTPEERRRIYEEEKARIEAQEEMSSRRSGGSSAGWWVIIAVVVAFMLLIKLTGDAPSGIGSGPSTPSASSAPNDANLSLSREPLPSTPNPPATGESVSPETESALNSMATKCRCTPEQAQRVVVSSRDSLQKEGVYESLPDLAQHIDESMPESNAPYSLPEMAATYVTLRIIEHKQQEEDRQKRAER